MGVEERYVVKAKFVGWVAVAMIVLCVVLKVIGS